MNLNHPKIKKIILQCQRRVQKLTGSQAFFITLYKPESYIPISAIIDAVTNVTGFALDEMWIRNRDPKRVAARQLVCFFAKQYCGMSHHAIAETVGYTDHTTCIASIKRVNAHLQSSDPGTADAVYKIHQQLKNYDRPPTTRTPDGDRQASAGGAGEILQQSPNGNTRPDKVTAY